MHKSVYLSGRSLGYCNRLCSVSGYGKCLVNLFIVICKPLQSVVIRPVLIRLRSYVSYVNSGGLWW